MQNCFLTIALTISIGTLAVASPRQDQVTIKTVEGYLSKAGMRYAPHPKNDNAVVVTTTDNEAAERVDLYLEVRKDDTLMLTCYAKSKGRYFNVSRVADKEKLWQRLLEENYAGFAAFYIDKQGDIGLRFTFTIENGLGYEAFSTAVNEILRIADQFTPKMEAYMQKPPSTAPDGKPDGKNEKGEKKPEKNGSLDPLRR